MIFSAALVVIAALIAGTVPGWAKPLRAAALVGYAPYSDDGLPGKGFSNDLLVQAMARAGYAVDVVMMPWSRALDATYEGTADILPSVWYSTERAEKLIYSQPYADNRIVFVKRSSDPFEYHSLADLAGKSIGIVNNYFYDPSFLAGSGYRLEGTHDVLTNLRKVAGGRLDLTLDDALTLTSIINAEAPELRRQLALTRGALVEKGLYMAFSRARPDAQALADAFNAALAAMRADGSYDRILAAHGMR